MSNELLLKKITSVNFRQVIYIIAGIYFLATGMTNKDWTFGLLSVLFLYQGIFNTCLFGSCSVPKR